MSKKSTKTEAERIASEIEGAVLITCRDANSATERYRDTAAEAAPAVVFAEVWDTHPTWCIAIADGCWDIHGNPPKEGEAGVGILVRKTPAS